MKYDLKDLILFTHIAKLKSFARAAEAMKISKATASGRIVELEKSLQLTLFTRTTREVNLTNEGKLFFDYCTSIIERVNNLDNFLENFKKISGVLKIAIPPYFSRYHIVPYLDEFLQKYPELKLNITLTENPINITKDGFDLQIRIQIPEDEDLEVTKLMTNEKVLCASPIYLMKYGYPNTPYDLLNHNCIIFGENTSWQFKHSVSRELIKLNDMKGNILCDNGEIIKELVLSGLGITIKSIRDIDKEIKEKLLIVLLPEYEIINKTQFYAVYSSAKYTSLKIKAFVEFFQNKLNYI